MFVAETYYENYSFEIVVGKLMKRTVDSEKLLVHMRTIDSQRVKMNAQNSYNKVNTIYNFENTYFIVFKKLGIGGPAFQSI